MNEADKKLRRKIIGGIGLGLVTMPAWSVLGGLPQQDKNITINELKNPTTKYPRPPFKEQMQPWPGLVSKMDPRPDHGEKSYKGSGRLLGRKALITGGDSGMGRAAAIAYAREGADVAINYLPEEEDDAKEVIALIRAEGRKAIPIPGDLREEKFCTKLVSDAAKALGGLDIIVNNAARQQSNKSILDISSEEFDWTMKTNIYALFWITKAALPYLKSGSCIIATTSVQATDPSADLFDYAQTKAANTSYVRSLAKQLGPKGIRVNGVWTNMDAIASKWWCITRKSDKIWGKYSSRQTGTTSRTSRNLCITCR